MSTTKDVAKVLEFELPESESAPRSSHCYAVFVQGRNKNRAIDPPCLDPLDFGIGEEPEQCKLLRRGRVALFNTREEAEREVKRTCELSYGAEWLKKFGFLFLECVNRSGAPHVDHAKRCQYLEARIEQLALLGGHVQVNDGGKWQSVREWAEAVIRGDDAFA